MKFLTFLLLFCVSLTGQAQNVRTYIHPRAIQYAPIILEETDRYFQDNEYRGYFFALIEHESCISLTHSRCFSPTAELNTKRELGIGFSQITKAYNADGSIRFDTLEDLKRNYKQQLKDLSWGNIKQRPDLQIRAGVLLHKGNYDKLFSIPDQFQRYAMADSAYNGGLRDVKKARLTCGLSTNCNPNIWFEQVERYSPKSTKLLYGNRSAKDINLHHVRDVMLTRLPKYQAFVNSLPKID